ncbi:hypothetical protein HDU82_005205, partial [Entophlyctis luteolus]
MSGVLPKDSGRAKLQERDTLSIATVKDVSQGKPPITPLSSFERARISRVMMASVEVGPDAASAQSHSDYVAVECIVDKRLPTQARQEVEYLVKFHGNDVLEWRPVSDLDNCATMIEMFEEHSKHLPSDCSDDISLGSDRETTETMTKTMMHLVQRFESNQSHPSTVARRRKPRSVGKTLDPEEAHKEPAESQPKVLSTAKRKVISDSDSSSDIASDRSSYAEIGKSELNERSNVEVDINVDLELSLITSEIQLHQNKCFRCGAGPDRKNRKDSDIIGVGGDLLSCSTCANRCHENCVSKPTKKEKERHDAECAKFDFKVFDYQCSDCFAIGVPTCSICHKLPVRQQNSHWHSPVPKEMGNPDPGESRDSSPDDELLVVIPLDSDDELEAAGIIPLFQISCEVICKIPVQATVAWPLKVESLLTFRDSRMEKETSSPIDSNVSTSREIYVKFANASNRWNEWVPEDWLHQQTAIKLNNFNREKVDVWQKAKDSIRGLELQPSGMYALPPSLVVSKDSLTAEKILDVKLCGSKTAGLKSGADLRKIELENVQEAFVKWKGLGYDSATWEKIPSRDVKKTSGLSPDDVVRNEVDAAMYPSFVSAFAGWKRRNAVGIFERNRTTSKNDKFVPYEKQPSFIEGGILKDYQIKIEGLNWLRFKWTKDLPCILADEMGLGKTVQIVSFITALMREYNEFPFLILAPAITIGHWLDEFAKWSPNTVTVHFTGQKPDRTAIIEHEIFRPKGQHPRTRFHVLLTAYENMMLEASFFKDIQFAGLICDEGHRLKNDESKTFRNLMAYIKARHKVILSGTPLQNNIRELFNLLNFLVDPEKYDDPKSLSLEFGMDNISQDDTIIPKIHEAEILVPVTLTHIQKKLYKAVLSKNFQLLRSIGVHGKDDKNSSSLKNVMMELRKICCHPYLANKGLEPENASPEELHKLLVESSGKLSLLQNMLRKLFNSDHRVLIFSQFKLALDIIEDFLVGEAYKFMRIDGDVPNHTRHSMINEFNANPKIFAFLLTTRTGGTGINLTAADTVIIYDCDWNPHQDIQAVARVHRIGQTRPVLIYRLFTRDTVEDSIIQRSTSKLALDKLVVGGMKDDEKYDAKELSSMLKFGAKRLFEEGDDPPSEQSRSAYDDAAVEKLLDRKGLIAEEIAKEDSKKAVDDSAQKSSFSFAKVWTLDSVTDVDAVDSASSAKLSEEGDDDFWDKLLQERLKQAIIAEEEETMNGLGKRRRQVVDYSERPKKKSVQQSDELEGEARFSDYEPDGDDPEDIEVSSGEDDTLDANPKMDSKMQPTHIVSSINASTSKPIFDEQYWVTHRFETVKNTLQSWIP